MDSINENQPENTHASLHGKMAVERIQEIVKEAESCFFCTSPSGAGSNAARPMSVQHVDETGTLWFLSASDSHKNLEIEQNPAVQLFFQASAHSGFLMLSGTAAVSTDKDKIRDLWKPILKTWFTGGVDDVRITALAVAPTDGYYWDNKHGDAVAGIKMMVGAALGKTLDDSIEGTLRV